MADVVHAGQQILVEIRLEVGIEQGTAVHVQLVFVRVETVAVRVFPDGLRALKESVLRQDVVMVAENNKIPLRHGKGSIGVSGDAPVLPEDLKADPGILFRVLLKHLLRAFSRRTAVGDADLELPVGLVPQGIQELPEITLRRRVGRDHHRKERRIRTEVRLPLGTEFLCRRPGLLEPLRVLVIAVDAFQLVL